MTSCKYCQSQIYWFLIDKKYLPFEDSFGSTPHRCTAILKQKSLVQRITELEELVGSLLNRVDVHSDIIEELEKNNDKN